jgi:hypothetical protein
VIVTCTRRCTALMLQVTRASEGVPTGVAQICVGTETGANSIVIVQGANSAVSPSDVQAAHSLFSSAKVIANVLHIHLRLPACDVACCTQPVHFKVVQQSGTAQASARALKVQYAVLFASCIGFTTVTY